MSDLTKEEFLSRCANAYDAGLCGKEQLNLLYRWIDFVMLFEGGQIHEVARFIQSELNRNGVTSTGAISQMAGDKIGYDITKFASILNHACQECAVDSDAWWTRSAFCEHKNKKTKCDF